MKKIQIKSDVMEEINKISEAAGYLWQREWAERNGGNISLNLTGSSIDIPEDLESCPYHTAVGMPAEAGNTMYYVSGTGERLRELIYPEKTGSIILIDSQAKGYYTLWGGDGRKDFKPTSEFISHLKIHLDKQKAGSTHRVVGLNRCSSGG